LKNQGVFGGSQTSIYWATRIVNGKIKDEIDDGRLCLA
jgi:hypothetical protein